MNTRARHTPAPDAAESLGSPASAFAPEWVGRLITESELLGDPATGRPPIYPGSRASLAAAIAMGDLPHARRLGPGKKAWLGAELWAALQALPVHEKMPGRQQGGRRRRQQVAED